MKTVAFVCLLTLSLCQSLPASLPDTPSTQVTNTTKPDEKAQGPTTALNKTDVQPVPPSDKHDNTEIINIVTTSEAPKPSEKTNSSVTPNENKPSGTKPEDNKTGNKLDDGSKPNETKTSETPKTDPNSNNKMTNETTTGDKDKKIEPTTEKATTTVKPTETTTVKPTDASKQTTEKPMVASRGFDGPSFIGGIILTLGLLAIGFMGFKYYKNQTERNYHTL